MPKKRWTLARLFYARVAADGGRRILSGPKMAPTAGRVAQAVRGVGRALRARRNYAKTPKTRKDWQPLSARSGVRALPFTSRTSWATRPAVGSYRRPASCATRAFSSLATAGLLLCAGARVLAADANTRFTVDVFGTAKGLPSSAVLAVTQTRDGYLWVGTLNGLARFDGAQFAVFDENNTPGLNSSQIIRLYEDRQTNLWVGTGNGGIYLVKAGKVTSVDVARGGSAGSLMAICEDRSGAVLLYSDTGQLSRYHDGKVDVWHAGSGNPSTCRALIAEDSGCLWVGTDTSLVALNPIPVVTDEVNPIRLNFLLASKRGGYWRLANGRIEKCKGNRVEDLGVYPWTNTLPIVAACEDQIGRAHG